MNKKMIIAFMLGVLLVVGMYFGEYLIKNSLMGPVVSLSTTTDPASSEYDATNTPPAQLEAQDTTSQGAGVTPATSKASRIISSVMLPELETGNRVVVSEATLSKPGFVVLYQINANGETAMIGHSTLLSIGEHTYIVIETNTVIAYSQAIVAVLHQDDGDGVFTSPTKDLYLENADGTIVSDIDVVGVHGVTNEARILQQHVEAYLKGIKTASSSDTNLW